MSVKTVTEEVRSHVYCSSAAQLYTRAHWHEASKVCTLPHGGLVSVGAGVLNDAKEFCPLLIWWTRVGPILSPPVLCHCVSHVLKCSTWTRYSLLSQLRGF